MTFFNRLTDIVTCNLSEILAQSDNPAADVAEIVSEMAEGLAGARRSVAAATQSEQRIKTELSEQREQADALKAQAREKLAAGDEAGARNLLLRKQETDALIAGLDQQYQAAMATVKHLHTTLRAVEAQHAEALRKQAALQATGEAGMPATSAADTHDDLPADDRIQQVEEELEALRRELDGGS